jgi:hypothetical protein
VPRWPSDSWTASYFSTPGAQPSPVPARWWGGGWGWGGVGWGGQRHGACRDRQCNKDTRQQRRAARAQPPPRPACPVPTPAAAEARRAAARLAAAAPRAAGCPSACVAARSARPCRSVARRTAEQTTSRAARRRPPPARGGRGRGGGLMPCRGVRGRRVASCRAAKPSAGRHPTLLTSLPCGLRPSAYIHMCKARAAAPWLRPSGRPYPTAAEPRFRPCAS